MIIQYSSDLHLEFGSKKFNYIVRPEADVHVFAGDMHTNPKSLAKFFRKVRSITPKPILYVYGNHEFYGGDIDERREEYLTELDGLVITLNNCWAVVEGVRILGTTLYSDLSNPLDAICVSQGMSDFQVVRKDGALITTETWNAMHKRSLDFLKRTIQPGDVVVTHFSPSMQLVPKQYKGSRTSAGYHSELYYLIEEKKPALWIYGHDHDSHRDVMIADTRVVCNQKGYPHENLHYAPRIVEVKNEVQNHPSL
jgi:hypothetical protein